MFFCKGIYFFFTWDIRSGCWGFITEAVQLFSLSSTPSICHFSFLMFDYSSGAAVFWCFYFILLVDILVYVSLLHSSKEDKTLSDFLLPGCF